MIVIVNGRTRPTFGAGEKRSVLARARARSVEGWTLSAAGAIGLARFGALLGALVVGGAISSGAIVAAEVADEGTLAGRRLWLAAAGLGAPALSFLVYQFLMARFRRDLPRRLDGVPPPGTRVAVGDEGVSVGDERVEWTKLRLEALELTETATQWGRVYRVLRARLSGPGVDWTLDAAAIENGQAIVDAVFRRLAR